MTQSTNKPRLGILLCGHSPDSMVQAFGRYDKLFVTLLGENTFEYLSYAVVDNVFPKSRDDADAWLITGSKHGVYEDHSWIAPLEQLVRDIHAAGKPLAGICFGHQLMAQALGGKAEKFEGGWNVGTFQYTLASETGTTAATLNAWHQDQVTEPPPNARVLGSAENCEFAALDYGQNSVSLQPHPEFEDDYINGLFRERGDTLPADIKENGLASLGKNLHNAAIAEWLRDVLSGGRAA